MKILNLNYETPLLDLKAIQNHQKLQLNLQVHNQKYYYTNQIPSIIPKLEACLPSVLLTKCYNDKNLPFRQEVKNTEMGHLLEHMILAIMVDLKSKDEAKWFSVSGETQWNWQYEPRGLYRMYFKVKPDDRFYFTVAVKQAVKLLLQILKDTEAKLHSAPVIGLTKIVS